MAQHRNATLAFLSVHFWAYHSALNCVQDMVFKLKIRSQSYITTLQWNNYYGTRMSASSHTCTEKHYLHILLKILWMFITEIKRRKLVEVQWITDYIWTLHCGSSCKDSRNCRRHLYRPNTGYSQMSSRRIGFHSCESNSYWWTGKSGLFFIHLPLCRLETIILHYRTASEQFTLIRW